MAGVKRETEIKFRVADHREVRHRLAAAGARFEGRFDEENYYFDDDAGTLRAGERILRLRRATGIGEGGSVVAGEPQVDQRLTYKEPVPDRQFKVREEFEVVVGDVDTMRLILERLGYHCQFRYRKEREIWYVDDVMVTLDTLSFGRFVELEGAPDALARVAARLGFDPAKGITKSYLTLAAEAAGQPPPS